MSYCVRVKGIKAAADILVIECVRCATLWSLMEGFIKMEDGTPEATGSYNVWKHNFVPVSYSLEN